MIIILYTGNTIFFLYPSYAPTILFSFYVDLCTDDTLFFLHRSIHRRYSYSPTLFLLLLHYFYTPKQYSCYSCIISIQLQYSCTVPGITKKKRSVSASLLNSYSSVPLSCIALNAADKPDNPFGSSKISSGLNGSLTSCVRLSETSTLSSLSVESLTFL